MITLGIYGNAFWSNPTKVIILLACPDPISVLRQFKTVYTKVKKSVSNLQQVP